MFIFKFEFEGIHIILEVIFEKWYVIHLDSQPFHYNYRMLKAKLLYE